MIRHFLFAFPKRVNVNQLVKLQKAVSVLFLDLFEVEIK